MIKDKVLIFNNYLLNLTDGGPSGFLAQNILGHNSKYYELNSTTIRTSFKRRLLNKLNSHFKKKPYEIEAAGLNRTYTFKDWCINAQQIFKSIQALKYKFIYFHDVWQLKSCLPLIHPSQIILLQSHCPELPSEEIASLQPKFTQEDVEWCKEAERDAFNRANILIFPNYDSTKIYASLISPKSIIYYLTSGAKEVKDLKNYPLNQNIQLLYVGRRNRIKGFDIIRESFQKAYAQRKDINLIVLGNGEKIEEDGIFDIGFSHSPHDWIYNCDYVINCNRQSYFDLSVLETLSIGTPLLISTNFGHRELAEEKSKGIIDIGEPTVQNLTNALLSQSIVKKQFNQQAIEENKLLFKRKYSDSLYRVNLEKLLYKIISSS
ncbi:glycosyltransferase [Scytonema sp. PCC 10023]|uniref:glycosyltransferase n=1 Tax=Scytonema sp. PCC 10023 TaxID=1680591 RepID=UPI0039C73307